MSSDPFDETRRQVSKIRRMARTRKRAYAGGAAFVMLAGLGFASYYQVEAEEVAVVLRFGKHIGNQGSGPHFRIPFVDEVIKVPVQRQMRAEFGFRSRSADGEAEGLRDERTASEANMLTARRNVATVEWIVQYIIDSPEKYVFNFRNVEGTLRLMAEATMRGVVGDYTIDELITEGRVEIEQKAQEALRELNRAYETGVRIQYVKLKRVDVPDPVKPALAEVEEAKQERARVINQAREERNRVIPQAMGRKAQAIAAARGYATARINNAEGDAGRFEALYREYVKAKDITRTRLYFEAMSEILPKAQRKILMDPEMKALVPLLNLNGGK